MARLYLIYEREMSLITFSDLEKKQHFIASEQRAGREAHEATSKMD
jgi:hypothetical protein